MAVAIMVEVTMVAEDIIQVISETVGFVLRESGRIMFEELQDLQ